MLIFFVQVGFLVFLTYMITCNNEESNEPIEETFILSSVICGESAQTIKDTLELYSGIVKADINIITKEAKVLYSPDTICRGHIDKIISSIGYNADNILANKKAFEELKNCCKVTESLEKCMSEFDLTNNKSCCAGDGEILRKK